jgi:putative transposase
MKYPSDLTDQEWALTSTYFEQERIFGRPLKYGRRSIVNAILYINKTGCQWRYLPKEYPPFTTVYNYFKKWSMNGTWEKVLDFLNKKSRIKAGKNESPTYGIIDSQSTKTQYHSEERGIDGGKKGKGS